MKQLTFQPIKAPLAVFSVLFAAFSLLGSPVRVQAQTWTPVYDSSASSDYAATRPAVGAGQVLVNNNTDVAGGIYATGGGLLTGTSDSSSSPFLRDFLARPASENAGTQRQVVTYTYSATTHNFGIAYQAGTKNCYLFSIGTLGPSFFSEVGGALTQIYSPGSWATAPSNGDVLTVDMQRTTVSPSTLNLIITDVTTGTVLVNQSSSDNTAGLQVPGSCVITAPGNTSTAYSVSRVQTFAVVPAVVLPNDPAWVYSPYNWTTPTSASTSSVNPGAYGRIFFTGTSAVLNFNTAGNSGTFPVVATRIDGGPWTLTTIAAAVTAATGLANRPHLLEFVFDSAVQNQDGWNAPNFVFTGLTLDSGATWSQPARRGKLVLDYGDSITRGNQVIAPNDDATLGYAYNLGQELNAEIGVIGFGGTGLTTTASLSVGNVPGLTSSYNYLYNGVSRPFSPAPNLILYAEGRNDGSAAAATVTANLQTVINAFLSLCPATKQVVSIPIAQTQAAALRQAVTNINSPLVSVLETSGFGINLTTDTSDGTHPYAEAQLGKMLPGYALGLGPFLYQTATSTSAYLVPTLTHNTSSQPVLTWTADSTATGYVVCRSVDNRASYQVIGTLPSSTLTYTDTTRPAAGTVYYHVVPTH